MKRWVWRGFLLWSLVAQLWFGGFIFVVVFIPPSAQSYVAAIPASLALAFSVTFFIEALLLVLWWMYDALTTD